MREIKFRVLEVDSEEMEYWTFKELCGSMSQSMGKSADGSEESFYKQFKVMQYTGLKDKNNKEIYEGDIVRYGKLQAVITWGEGVLPGFYAADVTDDEDFKYFDNAYLRKNITDIEVVGNIYENPELVK